MKKKAAFYYHTEHKIKNFLMFPFTTRQLFNHNNGNFPFLHENNKRNGHDSFVRLDMRLAHSYKLIHFFNA